MEKLDSEDVTVAASETDKLEDSDYAQKHENLEARQRLEF